MVGFVLEEVMVISVGTMKPVTVLALVIEATTTTAVHRPTEVMLRVIVRYAKAVRRMVWLSLSCCPAAIVPKEAPHLLILDTFKRRERILVVRILTTKGSAVPCLTTAILTLHFHLKGWLPLLFVLQKALQVDNIRS